MLDFTIKIILEIILRALACGECQDCEMQDTVSQKGYD